ncbi:hypothetical protein BG261_05350 [Floricoccus tropicus]|uniref:Uncharacterized protein n=1 Tax=Floricoccus tropicus TaxID=1859473 RepID=A0A1E8GLG2_9LACT|nr:hypothetical protein [Floricoccus tropicus]OFI48816.1 hypothetical protein BG261_05350 [Floricoccus tropicus]
MTKELILNVQRSGLPIKISGMEFFFESSVESIERYQETHDEIMASLDNIEPASSKNADGIEAIKEALTVAFDSFLGKGAFETLYKKFPDVLALVDVFLAVVEGIDEYVKEFAAKQFDGSKAIMKEYEEKKKQIKMRK